MKRLIIFASLIICSVFAKAQDINYARYVIDTLAAPGMHGRGYSNNGVKIAAEFIEQELKVIGVKSFNNSYLQYVGFPVNTFCDKMLVVVDSDTLKPVTQYIIDPISKGVSGTFPLIFIPLSNTNFDSLFNIDYTNKALVTNSDNYRLFTNNSLSTGMVIRNMQSPMWYLNSLPQLPNVPIINICDSIIANKKTITVDIENEFIKSYSSENIIGYVPGTEYPDSFVVFTAHYDHLGEMGHGNIFPGANDNASGVALTLNLARYFQKNRPEYSVAFMFFTGEEIGLQGSRQYIEQPLFPLSQISMLVNLDMVGTGSAGIGIVAGKENKQITSKIEKINNEFHYFDSLKIRPQSCISDHCPFYKTGVPAIFIYTMGSEYSDYHNFNDTSNRLPLTKYSELFKLLVGLAGE